MPDEYIRRARARERRKASREVSTKDLADFADAFADLADPEVMRQAWPVEPPTDRPG